MCIKILQAHLKCITSLGLVSKNDIPALFKFCVRHSFLSHCPNIRGQEMQNFKPRSSQIFLGHPVFLSESWKQKQIAIQFLHVPAGVLVEPVDTGPVRQQGESDHAAWVRPCCSPQSDTASSTIINVGILSSEINIFVKQISICLVFK